MITSVFVPTPCPCGRRHRLPAPPDGVIRWLCRGKVYTLRLQAQQFQRLLATTRSEQAESEGTCVLHVAGRPDGLQQRCEDCGWLLASYRMRVEAGVFAHPRALTFWPAGALVGRSLDGSWYLASLPASPHRERRCFMP